MFCTHVYLSALFTGS